MADIKANQNQIPADVSEKDAFNLVKRDTMMNTNCHAIATVQSFNKEKQTVTATVNYLKTYKTKNSSTGIYEYTTQKYPILIDCPVVFLRGGDFSLRFPVLAGDTCLILFNDRDFSRWLKAGQIVGPETNRLHSFADGIALVGISSYNNLLEDFVDDHAGFANGDTKLQISEDKILAENASANLGAQLDSLLSALSTLLTSMSTATAGNIPTSIATPAATALITVNTVKTALEGLLES